ncbi:aquaporin Z [Nakamurella deserti]|uniref:aquaporin Z n=1 Tax=Nakamurella deserti TaxID=2164074 RepID=UPI0014796DEB|nr:aquaporin Z [Nakamurella deserti]
MKLGHRLAVEFVGTFWLVFGGCGSAVLAAEVAGKPGVGIGHLGVALAFGLTVLTMAYAVGHISGGHFNPAVTVGLFLGKRFGAKDVLPYVGTQVVAAIAAAGLLYAVARGRSGFETPSGPGAFATNGYGSNSPGGFSLTSALIVEVLLTAVFVFIVLGVTDRRAPKGFGPIAIGLGLTLIHLVSIPVTNTSVNPARSTGPALFVGGESLGQLWLFWLAPLLGAAIAGLAYRYVTGSTGGDDTPEEAQVIGGGRTAGSRPARKRR